MTPEQRDGIADDTPLYALYRIYESIAADDEITCRNEIEFFFRRHEWSVEDIPDPIDPDPTRYAFLACIPDLLVEAFNVNIKDGLPRDAPAILKQHHIDEYLARPESAKKYERSPQWTRRVAPLESTLCWPNGKNVILAPGEATKASKAFKRMNINIEPPYIYFR